MSSVLKLSEASVLALHALALLARHPESRVAGADLARMLGASAHTLGKAMQVLTRGGLVDSVRGAKGGFVLARDPEKISLLEIYELVEGPLEETRCLLGKPACGGGKCVMRDLLGRLNAEARAFFARTALADLARVAALGDGFLPVAPAGKSAILRNTRRRGTGMKRN